MTKFFPSLVLLLLLASAARAAELTDLGQGLGYLRIHAPAEAEKSLRAAVSSSGALVLDLRHATADEHSAGVLQAGLTEQTPGTLVFVLVGPDTPTLLTNVLAAAPRSVLTLGLAGTQPAPKVVVKADAAAERQAFDALEAGTPIASLITGKVEKERFDEAMLMEEFKNGNPDADVPDDRPGQAPASQSLEKLRTLSPSNGQTGTGSPPVVEPSATKAEGDEVKAAPPIDRVLQRAVHLHRALLALRK